MKYISEALKNFWGLRLLREVKSAGQNLRETKDTVGAILASVSGSKANRPQAATMSTAAHSKPKTLTPLQILVQEVAAITAKVDYLVGVEFEDAINSALENSQLDDLEIIIVLSGIIQKFINKHLHVCSIADLRKILQMKMVIFVQEKNNHHARIMFRVLQGLVVGKFWDVKDVHSDYLHYLRKQYLQKRALHFSTNSAWQLRDLCQIITDSVSPPAEWLELMPLICKSGADPCALVFEWISAVMFDNQELPLSNVEKLCQQRMADLVHQLANFQKGIHCFAKHCNAYVAIAEFLKLFPGGTLETHFEKVLRVLGFPRDTCKEIISAAKSFISQVELLERQYHLLSSYLKKNPDGLITTAAKNLTDGVELLLSALSKATKKNILLHSAMYLESKAKSLGDDAQYCLSQFIKVFFADEDYDSSIEKILVCFISGKPNIAEENNTFFECGAKNIKKLSQRLASISSRLSAHPMSAIQIEHNILRSIITSMNSNENTLIALKQVTEYLRGYRAQASELDVSLQSTQVQSRLTLLNILENLGARDVAASFAEKCAAVYALYCDDPAGFADLKVVQALPTIKACANFSPEQRAWVYQLGKACLKKFGFEESMPPIADVISIGNDWNLVHVGTVWNGVKKTLPILSKLKVSDLCDQKIVWVLLTAIGEEIKKSIDFASLYLRPARDIKAQDALSALQAFSRQVLMQHPSLGSGAPEMQKFWQIVDGFFTSCKAAVERGVALQMSASPQECADESVSPVGQDFVSAHHFVLAPKLTFSNGMHQGLYYVDHEQNCYPIHLKEELGDDEKFRKMLVLRDHCADLAPKKEKKDVQLPTGTYKIPFDMARYLIPRFAPSAKYSSHLEVASQVMLQLFAVQETRITFGLDKDSQCTVKQYSAKPRDELTCQDYRTCGKAGYYSDQRIHKKTSKTNNDRSPIVTLTEAKISLRQKIYSAYAAMSSFVGLMLQWVTRIPMILMPTAPKKKAVAVSSQGVDDTIDTKSLQNASVASSQKQTASRPINIIARKRSAEVCGNDEYKIPSILFPTILRKAKAEDAECNAICDYSPPSEPSKESDGEEHDASSFGLSSLFVLDEEKICSLEDSSPPFNGAASPIDIPLPKKNAEAWNNSLSRTSSISLTTILRGAGAEGSECGAFSDASLRTLPNESYCEEQIASSLALSGSFISDLGVSYDSAATSFSASSYFSAASTSFGGGLEPPVVTENFEQAVIEPLAEPSLSPQLQFEPESESESEIKPESLESELASEKVKKSNATTPSLSVALCSRGLFAAGHADANNMIKRETVGAGVFSSSFN